MILLLKGWVTFILAVGFIFGIMGTDTRWRSPTERVISRLIELSLSAILLLMILMLWL